MAAVEDNGTRDGSVPRGSGLASSSVEDKVRALLANNSMDFSSWTSLIMEIDATSADDINIISKVYEFFLSEFPLCYGYWVKYANHKARLCSIDEVREVYEEAVKVASYSVDVWVNYCSFAMQVYEDLDDVRRLYERGLAFVGKDYLCSTLWDKCIEFEHSHKQWNHLVLIYIRSLRFPTKKLNSYYQSFKKLVAICEEELKCQNIAMGPLEAAVSSEFAELCKHSDSEITSLISDLLDQPVGLLRPKILQKILTIGEYFYQKSTNTNDKISYFEAQIWRPYFHIKPLDDSQLQVWNHYLDFVEMQGDFDWTVKLYERCLIPCANYPEFWVRYIEFMEARGGREIANLALTRASTTFLKRIPQFHQYCAKVKEQIGDAHVGHPCLLNCNLDFSSNFVGRVNQQANLEKRQGNIEAAYLIYEKVIEMVNMKQDMQTLATLYMHFARFTYVVTGDLGAAKEIFVKGISRAPYCKSLFEGLISFMAMHGGGGQVGAIDSIVGHAIVPEPGVSLALSPNDRKDVSSLFLEFVDLCGTIHEIRKAWARHMKLFQHVMRPCTSLSCNDNAIGVREKTKETNFVRDHDYDEDGIGDSNKYFLFDDVKSSKKNHDLLLVGPALASKFHSEEANNSTNGNQDQAQVAKDARKPSEQHPIEPCVYTDELLCKTRTLPHDLQVLSECPEAKDKSRRLQDSESHDDLRPSLVNLSISPPVDEQCHPDACDNNGIQMPSEETKRYCDSSEVGVVQQSDAKQTQPMISAIAESPADSNCKDTCTGQNQPAELNKVQTQQLALAPAPTNVMCPQNSVKWHQVHYGGQVSEQKSRFHGYVQSEQHQQWQVPVQLRYPHSGFNSQIPMAQTYAGQPQIWQANSQMANQPQGLYQRASSQVYPSGAIVLQAPNMQQDSMAGGGQPQLVTQMATQTHVYQHPLPSNGQHNYFQGGHGASNQFWHYYQQQQQQQQQNNIQLQHPQQQNEPHQQQQQQQQLQMNHWQQQQLVQQQQHSHPQQPQLQHHSQPCQPNKLHDPLPQQDLQQAQHDQQQQYVQQQSQQHLPQNLHQQQNQLLSKHQEQQQQLFQQQQLLLLQQQQQLQQQKQQTDSCMNVQTLSSNYYAQVQTTAQNSGQSGPSPKSSQLQSPSDQ